MKPSATRRTRALRTLLVVAVSGLLALAGACLLFIGRQPSSYRIERDTAVHASQSRVHALFSDVRALAAWDPWPSRSSAPRTTTFSTTRSGPGAWVQWSSRDGTTRMTIVSDTLEFVDYRDDVNGRIDASHQRFGNGRMSRVTTIGWTVSGKNDFLRRALWPFAALESRIGPDMEASLARLVSILDAPRRQRSTVAPPP